MLPENQNTSLSSVSGKLALYEALASNSGLQHIIDTAFALLQNPIFVLDTNYHFIARQADLPDPQADTPYARELLRDMTQDALQKDQITKISSWKLEEHTYNADDTYTFYNAGFGCRCMIMNIRLRGINIAQMMMPEDRPFTEDAHDLFRFLGSVVSQELQKDSFRISMENHPGSGFLFNILDTDRPIDEVMQYQLKKRGIKLKDVFRIAVVSTGDGMLRSLQADSISRSLHHLLPDSIYTRYDDSLVFLLQFPAGGTLKRETKEQIREKAKLNRVSIGISYEFRDLKEIRIFYRQAREAIDLGSRNFLKYPDDESLFFYSDAFCLDLLNTASQHTELIRLCHPYLLKLRDYDRENHTSLLESLFIYLQHGRNLRTAAEALYVHKNTMAYRLSKIRDLLDDDLDQEETLFLLALSYRILIFLNLFAPPDAKQ